MLFAPETEFTITRLTMKLIDCTFQFQLEAAVIIGAHTR